VPMKEEKEGKKKEKDRYSVSENIYYGVIWCGVFGIMIWFIVGIAQQYTQSRSSPTTVITFNTQQQAQLPKVTICNWNQIVEPYVPCDFCDLELILCQDIAGNGACEMTKMQIAAANVSDGIFNCYQFNGDVNNPLYSSDVGYYGSFSALFVVLNPPEDDTLRVGLQVSLTPTNVDPNVFNEDRFAPPGFDSYYAIQSIYTVFQNETFPNGSYPSNLQYDSSYSTTGLTRKNNDTHSFISVSWAYQTLNEEQISYIPQYTLNNFFWRLCGDDWHAYGP